MKTIQESSSVSVAFVARIARYLYPVEMFLTALLTFGILLPRLDIDSSIVILIAVGGLALVFFLQAYSPVQMPAHTDQPGFKELICFSVLPKVMWIATSVSTIGILFFLLDIANASTQMMMIGAISLAAGLLLTGVFYVLDQRNIKPLVPVLYRAVPVLLITAYILLV